MATKVPYNNSTQMGVFLAKGPAPSGNAKYSLQIKSGEDALISFPSEVTITSGNQYQVFQVTWIQQGTTILQAQLTEYDGNAVTGTIFEQTVICVDPPEAGGGGTLEATGIITLPTQLRVSVEI